MPNQAHSGIHGIPWHRCDRCGCEFPTSQLRRQRGLILCSSHGCTDDPLIWQRPRLIQDTLAQSADQEMAVAEILKQPLGSEMEEF